MQRAPIVSLAGLFFLLFVLLAPAASAQPAMVPDESGPSVAAAPLSPPPAVLPISPAAASPEETTWYGWQTLTADAATLIVSLGAGAMSKDLGVGGGLFLVGFGAAPVIIHVAHGRPLIGVLDLAMRTTAIVGGVGIGVATASCPSSETDAHTLFCSVGGAMVGLVVGVLAATALDAAALSWETKPAPRRDVAAGQGFTLSPTLLLTKEHTGLGLSGTF